MHSGVFGTKDKSGSINANLSCNMMKYNLGKKEKRMIS